MMCSILIFDLNWIFWEFEKVFVKKNQEKFGRNPGQWSINTNLPSMFSLAAWQFRDDGEARTPARLVHFLAMRGIRQRRHRAAIRGHIRVHMPVLVQFYGELHSQFIHAPACGKQMTQEKNSTVKKYTRRNSRAKADTAQQKHPLCVTEWSQEQAGSDTHLLLTRRNATRSARTLIPLCASNTTSSSPAQLFDRYSARRKRPGAILNGKKDKSIFLANQSIDR